MKTKRRLVSKVLGFVLAMVMVLGGALVPKNNAKAATMMMNFLEKFATE